MASSIISNFTSIKECAQQVSVLADELGLDLYALLSAYIPKTTDYFGQNIELTEKLTEEATILLCLAIIIGLPIVTYGRVYRGWGHKQEERSKSSSYHLLPPSKGGDEIFWSDINGSSQHGDNNDIDS